MNQLILMGAMLVAGLLGGIGQTIMKKASTGLFSPTNLWLWAFAICYGFGVIINFVVYKAGLRVSIGYPLIAISYVSAAFFAWKFLGEEISMWTVAGICCIVLGVGLIGWGAA